VTGSTAGNRGCRRGRHTPRGCQLVKPDGETPSRAPHCRVVRSEQPRLAGQNRRDGGVGVGRATRELEPRPRRVATWTEMPPRPERRCAGRSAKLGTRIPPPPPPNPPSRPRTCRGCPRPASTRSIGDRDVGQGLIEQARVSSRWTGRSLESVEITARRLGDTRSCHGCQGSCVRESRWGDGVHRDEYVGRPRAGHVTARGRCPETGCAVPSVRWCRSLGKLAGIRTTRRGARSVTAGRALVSANAYGTITPARRRARRGRPTSYGGRAPLGGGTAPAARRPAGPGVAADHRTPPEPPSRSDRRTTGHREESAVEIRSCHAFHIARRGAFGGLGSSGTARTASECGIVDSVEDRTWRSAAPGEASALARRA